MSSALHNTGHIIIKIDKQLVKAIPRTRSCYTFRNSSSQSPGISHFVELIILMALGMKGKAQRIKLAEGRMGAVSWDALRFRPRPVCKKFSQRLWGFAADT